MVNWAKTPLGVPVEELRPDVTYVRKILAAVYDIRLCEEMFDGWMTRLNKCVARFFDLVATLMTVTVITVSRSAPRNQISKRSC